MSGARPSPWPRVALLYLCGLFGAAQLGRLAALAPSIQVALSLGLTTVAAAISVIELGGATFGLGAGRLAHRIGLSRTLEWALASLVVVGFGGAMVGGGVALIGWRLVEAAGYFGIIVTAPVLIAELGRGAGDRTQGLAMTLWSTFFPVGFGLGSLLAAAVGARFDWRIATAASAAVGLALWLAVLAAHRSWPAGARGGAHAPPALDGPAVALALGFGAFTFFEVGTIALLPTLLTRETAMAADAAGRWTAAASVVAVAGSAIAAWTLQGGRRMVGSFAVALGLPALLLFGLFRSAPPPVVAVALAIAVNLLGGVFIGLAFVLLPRVAPTPSRLVGANALLAQCGAAGSLAGPPVMAACVVHAGWSAAAAAGLVASALSMAFTAKAAKAARDQGRPAPPAAP